MSNYPDFSNSRIRFNRSATVLIFLFIVMRLYLLQMPAIEHSVWKEIDYIEISKNYTKEGVQFWEPTISWPAEEPRITAMEFPLIPYLASRLYKLFGFNVFTLRILTLISFMVLSWYLYLIVKIKTRDKSLALLAMLMSLILPLNFIFGRLLFSEPAIIALVVISIYFMVKWETRQKRKYFILSFTFFSISLLLKPTAMYAALPLLYIYYTQKGNLRPSSYLPFALGLVGASIPGMIWYAYAHHLTNVSIDVFSVFGGHNKFQTFNMISDPLWWKIMFRRFQQLLGGTVFLIFFLVGLIAGLREKRYRIFYVLLVANIAFLFIIAEGNLDAPYRQFAFVASGGFFIALGMISLLSYLFHLYRKLSSRYRDFPKISPIWLYIGMVGIILLNFSYDRISNPVYRGHPTFNEIAEKLESIKNHNSKLVTVGNYSVHKGGNDLSPVLYYYADMQGWSLEKDDLKLETIEKLKARGADIFVGLKVYTDEASDFINTVCNKYPTVYHSKKYVICDLKGRREHQIAL